MVDRRRIVRQWEQGTSRVLVTLVRAEGSSYRRPGAHLLIGTDGEYAGTISGGCLEAEVVRKAIWLVRNGAMVERYSTLFDDTAEIPFGLGCGGVIDLLIEPSDTPECSALVSAMEASLRGHERIVATWLPGSNRPMRRAVLSAAGEVLFRSEGVTADDLDAIEGSSGQDSEIYVERLTSPLRLFVLGAGDDAKPVVKIASLLGWRVTVTDGRAQLAQSQRFPDAERVLETSSVAELCVTAADAVVIMTHSYEQDRAFLTSLLGSGEIPGYIGLLGASHRSSLLVSEAAAALGSSVGECCEKVWAPMGLDLGGEGAEAIALAVVAEIQAWRQGKLGSSRRLTAERVEQQVAKGGASRYLRAQCGVGTVESIGS
jgi:xanthine dehydrogenase accessory factor